MKWVFLHGFWGQASDWQPLINELNLNSSQVILPELLTPGSQWGPHLDYKAWADKFCSSLSKTEKYTLVGYSMGGRLALHLAYLYPDFWSRVVLLSTHPGLWDPQGVIQRRHWEQEWKAKFLQENWSELAAAWQQQAVFAGDRPVNKEEIPGQREVLAQALENWSSVAHLFDLEELKSFKTPLYWFAGERDLKYVGLHQWLKNQGVDAQFFTIEGIGHRLIFESGLVTKGIKKFIL